MNRRLTLAVAAIAAALLLAWWLAPSRHRTQSAQAGPRSDTRASARVGAPVQKAAAASDDPYANDAPSHLADALNDPSTDIHADLRLLDGIFQQFRSAVHGDNPVGDNIDITAALTGRNKLGFAFIPRDHPAIDAKGELCDRWGSPFFFHQLSGGAMEIRSAGPDRKLWTADDEVLTPGLRPPRL